MVTERLDMAVKNFEHMNQMVERYTRLCRAYVTLSERFHQLDVDHMTLKGQMIPLLKALKAHQTRLKASEAAQATLQAALDNQAVQHRQDMQNLTSTYEDRLQALAHQVAELQTLERLLHDDAYRELTVAEEQMELVETTFQEMELDSSPDLSEPEQALLAAYRSNPAAFLSAEASPEMNPGSIEPEPEVPATTMWHYYYEEKPAE
ncbi:MAG: hypothetical protein HC922_07575 [Leptolyngbyaceae cyanobacterium SM2_3_12]|nr:hypothetical protein [Leptolyngbyaceae cyanobacterium SM2_3_12]